MSIKYCETSIREFLDKVSGTDSMPGGGTVSALLAANAVSLALKVCNLSLNKDKYKDNEELIKESIEKLEAYRKSFLCLMDEDAEKFKVMEDVFRMPKETSVDKEKRRGALQEACKKCCEVPLEIIKKVKDAMEVMKKLIGKTNVSAESDLKLGIAFSITAIKGAWENISINLKSINDELFNNKYKNIWTQYVSNIE